LLRSGFCKTFTYRWKGGFPFLRIILNKNWKFTRKSKS
jgi:hypothetical protein